ncbi:MAG: hypothetical protein GTO60_08480, partial [Gammaproteobacteria bacterium]|nr:hypothetical protein [Gammaproteobacteria bacterium]
MMKRVFALCPLILCLAAPVKADIQSLLQLVDYMGVDYPGTWKTVRRPVNIMKRFITPFLILLFLAAPAKA